MAPIGLTTDLTGWGPKWRQRALNLGIRWIREEPNAKLLRWAHHHHVHTICIYHDAPNPPNPIALRCDEIEMDIEWWWRGVNLADWSREMLSEIRAIRRQHPHAKILLPLLAFSNNSAVRSGFDDSGTYRGSPAVAQINAAAPQIWALVDGFAVHPYSPGSPLSMHALDTVRRQLNQIPSARNKPFWITEMGWPTMGSPDAISEGEQAAWLADAIDELRGRSDVAAIMIYRLMDIAAPGASNDSESYYGIQRLDGSTKAAYRAVKARIR